VEGRGKGKSAVCFYGPIGGVIILTDTAMMDRMYRLRLVRRNNINSNNNNNNIDLIYGLQPLAVDMRKRN